MQTSSLVKNSLKTFILVNLLFLFIDLLFNLFNNQFQLSWPSYNILPVYLKTKLEY